MNIKKLGAGFAAAVIAVSAVTVTAFAAGTRVPINEKYFPDEIFREYVSRFDTDGNGSLSQNERDAVTEINVGFPNDDEIIKSLVGVGYFQNLKKLECSGNELTKLNVSKNINLKELCCDGNKLTSLNVSKNTKLEKLMCSGNKIEKLYVQKNTELKELYCNDCGLTTLNVSKNTKLTNLYCNTNKLKKLDLKNNTELVEVYCFENKLESLDISGCAKLKSLVCNFNKLTTIDASGCDNINITFDTGTEVIQKNKGTSSN